MPATTIGFGLAAEDVTLSYGGVRALKGVSLSAAPAAITGLIGPNGSGKSSFINIVSGAYRGPYGGRVTLGGIDVGPVSAAGRADLGLGRIFQGIRLFDTMTVEENILMGAHRLHVSSQLAGILRLPLARKEERMHRERAREIMATFGTRLTPRASDQVLSLSYANRRRVEIARALMSEPGFLLLDEPMAGMNPHETEELTGQLLSLNRDRGMTMLLVEHKMSVVHELCSDVYVLDSGGIISHGTPSYVNDDPKVVEAFLG